MPSKLAEKREELIAKQKKLADIFDEGKDGDGKLSLAKIKSLTGTLDEKQAEIKRMNDELMQLGKDCEILSIEEAVFEQGRRINELAERPWLPSESRSAGKSLGELFTEHPKFKARERGALGPEVSLDVDARQVLDGTKAVMTTAAGWAPQAIRTGTVVPAALRPVQVLDLIPQGETSQAAIVYMEETTATNTAAETNEGAAYPQATLVLTERTSNVRKVSEHLPVTDEQLEDIPQVQGYINGRLVFFVRQRLDNQVINGDGSAPNLRGMLNVVGIQTQAKGTDPGPDAIFKAMVKVRITGRAMPSGVIVHPTDWQNIRLLRTAEGVYIWGNPSEAGPERIWGLPIAQADSLSAGTAIVADFVNFTELDFRRNLDVQVGYNNDDFTKGQKSIRADVRCAFVVYRPAAICTVTGL